MPITASTVVTSSTRSSATSGDFERNIVPNTCPRNSRSSAATPTIANPPIRSTFQLRCHELVLATYDGTKMTTKQMATVSSAAITFPNQIDAAESGLDR